MFSSIRPGHRHSQEHHCNAVPVLHVCVLNKCLEHVQLPMVVAHQLPVVLLLLPLSLPAMAHLHQALLGLSLALVHLLEGRLGEVGVGSAYRSLPVQASLQGMLGSLCCLLVLLPGAPSNLCQVWTQQSTCRLHDLTACL